MASPPPPAACRALHAERHNPLQQVRIGQAVVERGGREFLALRDLGIGIRFEKIKRAVGGEAKIDAGVAVELERPVDPFRGALDPRIQVWGKILRRSLQYAPALLVAGIVLDLLGRDVPRALGHLAE
jgi:hypothetical protein